MARKPALKPEPGKAGNRRGKIGAGQQEQPGEMIMAVVIPADVYSEILTCLEELPRARTKLLWKQLETFAPQMVPVNRG
jgi:hypothetical protein